MTRHVMFTALCFCVLAIGCERKADTPAIAGPDPTTKTGVPAGKGGSTSFLCEAPVTLDQGTTYRVSKKTPLMPLLNPSDPLAAIAHVKYIPTGGCFTVLEKAMKGSSPWYLATVRNDAENPIATGWINSVALIGQNLEALAAKLTAATIAQMKDAALDGIKREISGLRATLSDRIEATRAAYGDHWLQLKPALFSFVEEQKTRDELRQTTSPKLLRTVEGVNAARLRLRRVILTSDADDEKVKAIKEYEDTLATTRKVLAANLTDLATEQKTISARIRDVTTKLERAGDVATNRATAVQADLLARTQTPAPTREHAEANRAALKTAIADLADVKPAIGKLPSLDDIAKDLTAVKAEIALLREKTPGDPLRSKLVKQLELLTKPDASIQRQFDQEPLLLKDIDAWGEALARRDVLAAKLKRLQGYLTDATPPADAPL